MLARDVVEVFIAQDRVTGNFFDLNMSPVTSLRHAARADSVEIVHESMADAILSGGLDCEDGYEVHSFLEYRHY
jgi:hypothetical protein